MCVNQKQLNAGKSFSHLFPHTGRLTTSFFVCIAFVILFTGTWKTWAQEPNESEPPANLPQTLPGGSTEIPAWAGKDKDEPFDVKKFLESRMVDPTDNAAPLYFWAFADVSTEMDFVYSPDQWQARLPQVQALQNDIGNLADDEKLKAGSIPLADIERVLKAAQPTQDKIDQAQHKKRCVFITGISFDSPLNHVQAARQIARLELLQIYHARAVDDFAEAEQAVTRSLRLSRDLCPRGLLVSQLVSFAINGIIWEAINNYTLVQPSLTPEQCDRLLALLAERERLIKASLTEGLKMEYIVLRNTYDDLQNGRKKQESFVKELGNLPVTEEQLAKLNWRKEISALNRSFAGIFATATKPYDKSVFADLEKKEIAKLKAEKIVLTPIFLPALSAVFNAQARMQARLAGTQCLIAVRRYMLVHDELPADLAVAVTEAGLKEVPLDPYDGKPIRYKIINDKPVVYSIGPNRKDDGATVEWKGGATSPGDMIFRLGE